MPKLSKDVLRSQLQKRNFAPVYALYGQETFLRDGAVEYIARQAFGDDDLRDFNDVSFSLNDPDAIKRALAAADQLPMMSQRRLVRVTDVRVASTSARDTLKEDHLELLTGYLENPAPHSILVLIADEMNANRKIAKLIDKYAATVDFRELAGSELSDWIAREFQRQGSSAEPAAVRRLEAVCGSGLRRLANEIGKLAAASMPNGLVSAELVDELVSNSVQEVNFALTDHLLAGRGRQAVTFLRKILDDGAEPVALLGLIASNYRRLVIVKDSMQNSAGREEVIRDMGMRRSFHESFMATARRSSMSDLTSAIEKLAVTDKAIKSSAGGKRGAEMLLEMLVCDLSAAGET